MGSAWACVSVLAGNLKIAGLGNLRIRVVRNYLRIQSTVASGNGMLVLKLARSEVGRE